MGQWIPILECLPKEGQKVLISKLGTDWLAIATYQKSKWLYCDGEELLHEWTHWMELPEPPK